MKKRWTVKENYIDLKAGDTVYPCAKYDYGGANDDTRILRELCISVSKTEDGDYPFTTIPVRLLTPAPTGSETT